jgi:hypothetical protein
MHAANLATAMNAATTWIYFLLMSAYAPQAAHSLFQVFIYTRMRRKRGKALEQNNFKQELT